MAKMINLTGKRFGRLVVAGLSHLDKYGRAVWSCHCDCGNNSIVAGASLRTGDTKSCGCIVKELLTARTQTHGMTSTKVYKAWRSILYRCNNPKAKCYPNYGGRGITVSFGSFEEFYAEVGDPKPGESLDRINNDRGYEPGNLRWTTNSKQLRNTRRNHLITLDGETRSIVEWSERTGLPKTTILSRLSRGESPEQALSPVLHNRARA